MSINIEIPSSVQVSKFEITMMLAAKLFDEGLISSGQGAEMVGLSKRAFVEMLGKYKVSLFGYDFDEILEDIEHVK